MQAMSKIATEGGNPAEGGQPNPFTAGMWPWNMMQGAAEQAKAAAAAVGAPVAATPAKSKAKDGK